MTAKENEKAADAFDMRLYEQEGLAEALGGESAANERTPIKDTQHD
jgi:hypothetical protein